MIPEIRLSWWRDAENPEPMLTQRGIAALSGAVELTARVETPIGCSQRFLCAVRCLHPTKPIDALADVVTGSLYVNGRCLSGPLRIIGKPRKTGRNVPGMVRRNGEAAVRSVDHYVVTGVLDDA